MPGGDVLMLRMPSAPTQEEGMDIFSTTSRQRKTDQEEPPLPFSNTSDFLPYVSDETSVALTTPAPSGMYLIDTTS